MAYGYAEYTKIKNLLEKYNVAFSDKDYEKFMTELVDILELQAQSRWSGKLQGFPDRNKQHTSIVRYLEYFASLLRIIREKITTLCKASF